MQRAVADLSGRSGHRCGYAAVAAPCRLAGELSSAGRTAPRRRHPVDAGDRQLRLRARGGRRRARNPGGPRARRNHRTRAFPLFGGRREGAQTRGTSGLCSQGDRTALHGIAAARWPPTGGPRLRRFGGRIFLGLLPGLGGHGAARMPSQPCILAARAGARIGASCQSPGRSRRDRQRCRLRLRPGAVLPAQGAAAARNRGSARAALSHGFRRAGRYARRPVIRWRGSC